MLWTEHFILLCVTPLTYMYSVTIFCAHPYLAMAIFGCSHVYHLVSFTTQFKSVTSLFSLSIINGD